jgi:microsomal dipeptidase-like Zn-dependent dipeptidase
MHLLPGGRHPREHAKNWSRRLREELEAEAVKRLAPILNDPGWSGEWRVDLEGLEQGGARLVCSVLYWPAAEFDFARPYGSDPLRDYYDELQDQLGSVEHDLHEQDPDGQRHLIAKSETDLDDAQRVVFVHCVEGGFHLGPEEDKIDERVGWLAEQGVVYITVAHLFFRGVATNAPAIPVFSDAWYERIFHQDPNVGLTSLGEALVRAMYSHKVLIDVSHMGQKALDATFALVEQLDREADAAPTDYPLIATHVGMRDAGPDAQAYNLSAETATRIQERGGLIGLITSQHQLGKTHDQAESRAALARHIDAIGDLGNGHQSTALGTDLDGFIKPTLKEIERAPDLKLLEEWIRDRYDQDADAILYTNAHRVLRQAFAARP